MWKRTLVFTGNNLFVHILVSSAFWLIGTCQLRADGHELYYLFFISKHFETMDRYSHSHGGTIVNDRKLVHHASYKIFVHKSPNKSKTFIREDRHVSEVVLRFRENFLLPRFRRGFCFHLHDIPCHLASLRWRNRVFTQILSIPQRAPHPWYSRFEIYIFLLILWNFLQKQIQAAAMILAFWNFKIFITFFGRSRANRAYASPRVKAGRAAGYALRVSFFDENKQNR